MKSIYDLLFGNQKESYRRARINTGAGPGSDEDVLATLRALDGDDSFLLGTLPSGEEVRLAAREVGRHGMVWG